MKLREELTQMQGTGDKKTLATTFTAFFTSDKCDKGDKNDKNAEPKPPVASYSCSQLPTQPTHTPHNAHPSHNAHPPHNAHQTPQPLNHSGGSNIGSTTRFRTATTPVERPAVAPLDLKQGILFFHHRNLIDRKS